MKKLDNILIFKSKEPFFTKERAGYKSHTVRLFTKDKEVWLKSVAEEITHIRIVNKDNEKEYFEREITDTSKLGEGLGVILYSISWMHNYEEVPI